MTYPVTSKAYLRRARTCLDEGTPEQLFYAAMELRCGIEARAQEYLHPHPHVSEKRKSDYSLRRLAKELEKVSLPEDQVMAVRIFNERKECVGSLFYTPITGSLRRKGERLGDLLHAQQTTRSLDDPWWAETRAFLEDTWEELRRSTLGDLLGAMLFDSEGKLAKFSASGSREILEALGSNMKPGDRITVQVQYLKQYPEELLRRSLDPEGSGRDGA